jgi:homoserine O-acetyltransferase/O-succinyltransferase
MKIELSMTLLAATLSFVAVPALWGQAQTASTPQQFAALGEFKLQSGEVMHDFRLGYRTAGALNAEKSNAVLWPTWLGGRTEDLLRFIGPNNVVDSSKYFVILVDAIGNGVSTSPSNSLTQRWAKFPRFTIRDMVESERRLLTEVLHLTHVRAVMGVSMGGMQTFEWIVAYPDFADLAIPIAGSSQSTSYDKLLWTCEIQAIELDPAWNQGNPTGALKRGPALSEEIGSMNVTSPAYRVAQTRPKDFDTFVAGVDKNAKTDGGSAWDAIRQREAIIALDIPAEYGETPAGLAKRVRAKVLAIVSPEDHMVNPQPAVEFATALGAPILQLDTACGHLSVTCISVGPLVAQFLADPSSVHSATLDDSSKR